MTMIYQAIQEKWERRFSAQAREQGKPDAVVDMADWGPRFWGKVKAEQKRIDNLLLRLDMNVICTSHMKDVYASGMTKVGVAPDAMRGTDYLFDTVIRLEKTRAGARTAFTEKDRTGKFPEEFKFDFATIRDIYGKDIMERAAATETLATPAQCQTIKELIEIVKLDDGTVDKWMEKANASKWEEFTSEQAAKIIDHINAKLGKGKAKAK
jgi:hypothetical protein